MIAFWGEPGAHEPTADTPLTFLGTDNRWRKVTGRDLGDRLGYLSAGQGDLSPDGSRWVFPSRGWNTMIDFSSARLVKLTRGSQAKSASWSPDSASVALWTITEPGIEIFDRAGRRIADLPINIKKRSVLMPDSAHITIFDPSDDRTKALLRFTTYDLDGKSVSSDSCELPDGYPPRATGVSAFDGKRLWISALVDSKNYTYRHSIIDTSTGRVTQDVEYTGTVPYFDQWVPPGVYMAGIVGAPDGIYAADADTGEVARLSRIGVYQDQEGYENHAGSQFATDLVFGDIK